jgi:hypothetical protein
MNNYVYFYNILIMNRSESVNSNISKNDEIMNLDLSPVSQKQLKKEVMWFPFNRKPLVIKDTPNFTNKRILKFGESPSKRWGHSCVIYNKSMVIFGGRHSARSLSNIYLFDFVNLTWNKVDPLGQTPPARDSHSSILVIID